MPQGQGLYSERISSEKFHNLLYSPPTLIKQTVTVYDDLLSTMNLTMLSALHSSVLLQKKVGDSMLV
jgi:hypothetical protein